MNANGAAARIAIVLEQRKGTLIHFLGAFDFIDLFPVELDQPQKLPPGPLSFLGELLAFRCLPEPEEGPNQLAFAANSHFGGSA